MPKCKRGHSYRQSKIYIAPAAVSFTLLSQDYKACEILCDRDVVSVLSEIVSDGMISIQYRKWPIISHHMMRHSAPQSKNAVCAL